MYLFSALIAFFITLTCMLLLKPLAVRLDLVDAPNSRKHHQGDTPLIGGLAMFTGFLAALLTLPISLQHYRAFIAGCALLVFTGLLDDFHELSPKSRFFSQIFALILMFFWGGIKLTQLGDLFFCRKLNLSITSLPVTVIAGLGIINAINMLDGIDGLAGTVVLSELLLLSCCAITNGQFLAVHILLVMIAVVCAFLCLNFRWLGRSHAQVFMGDAGSMFLGFALVWFLIEFSQSGSIVVTPVTMLWLMILPLFDTTAVILYRISKKKSVFSSDREHLHHLLSAFNLSPAKISLSLGAINLVLGGVGLLAYYCQWREGLMFIGFLILFVLYFIGVSYLRVQLYKKRNSVVFAHLLSKN